MGEEIKVRGTARFRIDADGQNQKIVTARAGTAAAYYGNESVSATSNDGTISAGQSVTLTQTKFFKTQGDHTRLMVGDSPTEGLVGLDARVDALEAGAAGWYNAKAYGAAGDGEADDREFINAAIYDAHLEYVATGVRQTVWLPAGQYYTPVPSDRYTYFPGAWGFGGFCGIYMRPGVNLLANGDAALTGTKADGEYLLTVVPTGTAEVPPHATQMGGDDWSIRGVIFDPGTAPGAEINGGCVALGACANWAIADCEARNTRGDFVVGLGVSDGTASPSKFRFERNEIHGITGQALLLHSAGEPTTDGVIADNHVYDQVGIAEVIAIIGDSGVAVKSNRITFTGNRIDSAGGVVFDDASQVTIANNDILMPAGAEGPAIGYAGDDIVISGNRVDCSLVTGHFNNGPLRAEGASSNVVISGNQLKLGWAGMLFDAGSGYSFTGNVVEKFIVSTDDGNGTAVNMDLVDGAHVTGNRLFGLGLNTVKVGDESTVTGNFIEAGRIVAGKRCAISGNRVEAAADAARSPQTYKAVDVDEDSTVTGNSLSAGTDEGAIFMRGARTLASGNLIENTFATGIYVFADHADNWADGNMGIATAAVGGTAGYGGFGGARSGARKLATPATYTASNVSTDRSFDANATTTDELADALGTLIADLRAAGVLL